MSIKRLLKPALVLSLLAALTLPGLALAASGNGNGALRAWGNGVGVVRGNGSMTLSGNGSLWVQDNAGDMQIYIQGEGVREDLGDGWTLYSGFDGTATISGSEVTVAIAGDHIRMYARGAGHFALRGEGGYRTSGDGWTMDVALLDAVPGAAVAQP